MARPETRYAKSGDTHIAYQVLGGGPLDLVFVPGFISNLEHHWEDAGFSHLLLRLASFSRLILFDKRGTGLSDRVADLPSLEQRMDDVRAVMDAVGSRRAALLGASEGGPMSILFAATYPERTRALVLYGSYAHFFTWVMPPERLEAFIAGVEQDWGNGRTLEVFAPGMVNNTRFREWWARFERVAASPAAAVALARMNSEIDVRPVLPAVRVPTLILHRRDDARISVEGGRYLAAHIEGARYVEAPGIDHPIFIGETDTLVDEIEEFLTGHRPSHAQDRMLATVLALELAEKTPRSGPSHDRAWCEAMLRCGRPVAEEIGRWRGRVLAMTADRGLAAFDGPARAVRCALALRRRLADFGLTLRAGLHLGELELRGDAASGAVLDSAAHVARLAAPGEVLVSAAVRDLVSGSGLQFEPWTELHAGPFTLFCARDDLARHDLARGDLEAGIRRPPGRPAAGPPLSPREREVLALVARGLTNAEIALALNVSDHTAKRHVANILTKLDLPSRAAAAAYAARQSGEASNA